MTFGKPQYLSDSDKVLLEAEKKVCQDALEKAIKAENYEFACKMRDKIRGIDQRIKNG